MAEGSAEFDLPVSSNGVMRLTRRLRETYLSPETNGGECITQLAGERLFVWVPSERHDIRLEVQTETPTVRRPYEQSVYRWGVNLNRYLDDPGLEVDRTGEKPEVSASVDVISEVPDV